MDRWCQSGFASGGLFVVDGQVDLLEELLGRWKWIEVISKIAEIAAGLPIWPNNTVQQWRYNPNSPVATASSYRTSSSDNQQQ